MDDEIHNMPVQLISPSDSSFVRSHKSYVEKSEKEEEKIMEIESAPVKKNKTEKIEVWIEKIKKNNNILVQP